MIKTIKRILSLSTIMCSLIPAAFAESSNFQENLEESIAVDQGFDDVLVHYSKGVNLSDDYELVEVKYEKQNHRFKALATNHEGDEVTIIGRYEEAILIPVLIEPVNTEEPIAPDNIAFKKYPKNRDLGQIYRSKDSLVGRFAKKRIAADKPLSYQDLGLETLVQRGQTVRMLFQKNGLFIETVGMSLDAGGLNETIRVKNLDSSRIVRAKIKDPETVLVGIDSVETEE